MNLDNILNSKKNKKAETWKGVVSGLVGGLAGALAMSMYEKLVVENHEATSSPTVKATNAVLALANKKPLSQEASIDMAQVGKYPFGAILGSTYGALVEKFPLAKQNHGLGLSALTYTAVNRELAPNMSLMTAFTTNPKDQQNQEIISLVIFGATTEFVRRGVRQLLG